MPPPIIAIVSPGAMGAGVAHRLTGSGVRVLSSFASRSETTSKRAMDSGMVDAPLSQILQEADWLLSILPPNEAEGFVRDVIEEAKALGMARHPIFVDCNAKNTKTTLRLASLFTGEPFIFINACIIGLPPEGSHDPVFYASTYPDPRNQQALSDFSSLNQFGLRIKIIAGDGADLCDASTLKMTFSGIMKGMVGIYETMMLAAYSYSPATASALVKEMRASLPFDLAFIHKYVPQSFGKAYRFVREMKEMEEFVHDNVDATNTYRNRDSKDENVATIYSGLEKLFERIAASDAGGGRVLSDGSRDVEAMLKFVEEAKLDR